MSGSARNVHATAIVVATTGLLFIGSSGIGKSRMAHACLVEARLRGLFARLVADDQVLLSSVSGRVVAARPESIAGLLEMRGTGIAHLPSTARALMHFAVAVEAIGRMERMPEAREAHPLPGGMSLPLVRIACDVPHPLLHLSRFIPFLGLLS